MAHAEHCISWHLTALLHPHNPPTVLRFPLPSSQPQPLPSPGHGELRWATLRTHGGPEGPQQDSQCWQCDLQVSCTALGALLPATCSLPDGRRDCRKMSQLTGHAQGKQKELSTDIF